MRSHRTGRHLRWTRTLPAMASAIVLAATLAPTPSTPPAGAVPPPMPAIEWLESTPATPYDITVGPDGQLWYADAAMHQLGRIGTDGAFDAPLPVRTFSLTPGHDGDLWYTDWLGVIGHVDAAGSVATLSDPGIAEPVDITAGPDAAMWFTDDGSTSTDWWIGRIATDGTVSTFTDDLDLHVGAIAAGPDGNVWFTSTRVFGGLGPLGTDGIVRMTPDGTFSVFTHPDVLGPSDLVAGPDGNLWFTYAYDLSYLMGSAAPGGIGRITPDGDITTFTGSGISSPRRLTLGPDDALWFTDVPYGVHSTFNPTPAIGRITTAGTVTRYQHPDVLAPGAIVAGPDGALWFTDTPTNAIGRITTDGAITMHPGRQLAQPRGVAVGPDGRAWTAAPLPDAIEAIAPDGTVTRYQDPGIAEPIGITTGPDGNLWYTDQGLDAIGRITPDGVVDTFTGEGVVDPLSITTGPDGNLWFTNAGSDSIGTITPTGTITNHPGHPKPKEITAGPDGNLWFTSDGVGAFGSVNRLTTDGAVTSYTGNGIVLPAGITTGPDGNVWFASWGNKKVGRITPAGAVTTFAVPGTNGPRSLVAGGDGNLWIQLDGAVGRMTTSGELTTGPTAFFGYSGMATAPDGDVWLGASYVTTNGYGKLARVELTPPAAPPGAPTDVVVTAGDGEVALTWAPPPYPWTSPVVSYTATAQPGGVTCTRTTGPLACTISGLTNGLPVTVTVTATNATGTGPASAPSAPVRPTVCSTTPGTGPFPDVGRTHAFCDEIEWLAAASIAAGYPDGGFHPAAAVTRQAMAAFLWRAAGEPAYALSEPFFADVPADHPYYDAIQWMADTGLSTGTPGTGGTPTFAPTAKVSRQAMASFLWRNAGEPAPTLTEPAFADVPAEHTFYDAIQWMAETGLSVGTPAPPGLPRYLPTDPVSRQATAAFLFRAATL